MSLDLSDYEAKARNAIRHFWKQRHSASKKNGGSERRDQGERGAVTAGKNMDGFVQLVKDVVRANGLPDAECHASKQLLTLPGYFRPTKMWDLVVTHKGRLIAAIEFKSHVGPSFGNNFNNRTEEAIGTAVDIWTAYREGAFGKGASQPFVGWLMLLEEAEDSTRASRLETLPHFAPFPEFVNSSYAQRYEILCEKLVREQLYTASALMLSPRTAIRSGSYREMGAGTGLQQFLASLAGFVAAEGAKAG